jgi:hypothetical protein
MKFAEKREIIEPKNIERKRRNRIRLDKKSLKNCIMGVPTFYDLFIIIS